MKDARGEGRLMGGPGCKVLVSTCGERVSYGPGDYRHRHWRHQRRPELLLRLIVDEANISINRSLKSHDTIKTLFVDYDGGLVMEPG